MVVPYYQTQAYNEAMVLRPFFARCLSDAADTVARVTASGTENGTQEPCVAQLAGMVIGMHEMARAGLEAIETFLERVRRAERGQPPRYMTTDDEHLASPPGSN